MKLGRPRKSIVHGDMTILERDKRRKWSESGEYLDYVRQETRGFLSRKVLLRLVPSNKIDLHYILPHQTALHRRSFPGYTVRCLV